MNPLQDVGLALVQRGWNIVPLRPASKIPAVRDWRKLNVGETLVRAWLDKGMGRFSVGINAAETPAIDLDIYDGQVVKDMIAAITALVGEAPVRVGRVPKALLAFRCLEPFTKLKSGTWQDDFGALHHVEILGDGQQYVAAGIHPDTQRPYAWSRPLERTSPYDLPILTRAHAEEVLSIFEGMALRQGWELVRKPEERSPLDEETLALLRALPKPENVDVPSILRTLSKDADDRQDYLRVGMALHHHYEGSNEGLDLWEEFAQGTSRGNFNIADLYRDWHSFKDTVKARKTALVTMRSLIKRAHEVQRAEAVISAAKATVNGTGDHPDPPVTEKSAMAGYLERYIFIRATNTVHDLQRPAQDADTVYGTWLSLVKNEFIPVADEDGKVTYKQLAEMWIRNAARLTAERTVYEPDQPRLIRRGRWSYVNVFSVPEHPRDDRWELTDRRFAPFMEHMEYLVPDERERAWFLDWITFTVAQPAQRSKVTPLHISLPHGTGRGWVHELISEMLGPWNCKKTTMATFIGDGSAGQFQDYMYRSRLVSIEEVKDSGKRFGIDDRVRDKLEAPRLEINLKYGGKDTIPVFCNFFLMSNHPDALAIGPEDRRIQVLSGPNTVQPRSYFQRLYDWLKGEAPPQLYYTLCRRDLTNFNWQRSDETFAGRAQMISAGMTDTEAAFRTWIANQPKGRKFTFLQLTVELAVAPYYLEDCNEKMLAHLLRGVATQLPTVESINGVRARPWVLRAGG